MANDIKSIRKNVNDTKNAELAKAASNDNDSPIDEIKNFKTTAEITVPTKIVDQIIGQEKPVEIIRKAASQRRNVLLLGSPGTGKSMLAQGMAELMPAEELQDVLTYPNDFDENNPKIRVVQTYPNGLPPIGTKEELAMGQGRQILFAERMKGRQPKKGISPLVIILIILIIGIIAFQFVTPADIQYVEKNSSIVSAIVLGGLFLIAMWLLSSRLQSSLGRRDDLAEPKLIVDNTGKEQHHSLRRLALKPVHYSVM